MNASSLFRLILLAAIWGGSFLFMRIGVPALGAVVTAFARVTLGAVGLVLLVKLMRLAWRFDGKFAACMILGVINAGIPFLLFCLAAKVLPAGYSAILNATAPLMGALIGYFAFGENMNRNKLGGLALGLFGVAVLTRTGPVEIGAGMLGGVLLCLLATACYGWSSFLARRWITQRGGLDSRLVAMSSQFGAVLVLLPFAGYQLLETPVVFSAVGPRVWLSMLALGFVCTSLAFVLYFRLIADIGPLKTLTVTFLIPAFGVLWGWLLLDETVTLAHLAGGALIAAALWLVMRPPQRLGAAGQ